MKEFKITLTDEYFRNLDQETVNTLFDLLPQLCEKLAYHAIKLRWEDILFYRHYIVQIEEAMRKGRERSELKRYILKTLFTKLIQPESGFGTDDNLRDMVLSITEKLFPVMMA
jgi:hypothetical protein